MKQIVIATRQSPLALWQAEFVKAEIERTSPGVKVVINGMTTRADEWLKTPLAKMGGKGLFVKELEEAMLAGNADIAVHSMKDVPMELPAGLELQVICQREDPTDAFVSNHFSDFDSLPQEAVVGTSSLRRQCQLLAHRPDLKIRSLRGNVNTRLRKLDEGEFDAIILASAGLIRLGMGERITQPLAAYFCLPAGGQGAVGIEARSGDAEVAAIIAPLHHADTAARVIAERSLNQRLNGSCQVPIACHAVLIEDQLHMNALVGSGNGDRIIRARGSADKSEAHSLGQRLAEDLLAQGAEAILSQLHEQPS